MKLLKTGYSEGNVCDSVAIAERQNSAACGILLIVEHRWLFEVHAFNYNISRTVTNSFSTVITH